MSNQEFIPVYLITGFLESGKTSMIRESMENPKFDNGERTLKVATKFRHKQHLTFVSEQKQIYLLNQTIQRVIQFKHTIGVIFTIRFLAWNTEIKILALCQSCHSSFKGR